MQGVSGAWAAAAAAAVRKVGYGLLMSWDRSTATTSFFTIGTSSIGGPDIIKGGGGAVTFFDKYKYLNYSKYAMAWSVQRQLGVYPYGVILAQADLTLDNSSKLFTPGYDGTIGAYVDKPNRPLKLSASLNGESLQQFVGFTDVPEVSRRDRTLKFHAYDVLTTIMGYQSALGPQVGLYFHQIIANALTEMGFSSSQYVLDVSLQAPIGYLNPHDLYWGDIFQQGCEAEQGLLFVDENGIIRFWNRQHFISNSTVVQSFTVSNLIDYETQSTPIFNSVTVRAKPRSVRSNRKVWELQGTILVPAGTSVTYPINFVDDFGALPVATVDLPLGYSSSTTSRFMANTAVDNTGTDVTGSVSVSSATLVGTSYLMTITNSGAVNAYVVSMSVYGTPAEVVEVIEQVFIDQASITAYGFNPGNNGQPLEIENDLIQDSSTAGSLCYSIVKDNKDPHRRYEAPCFANPALQIGDFVGVTDSDTGVTKNLYVTGIKVGMGYGGDLSQSLVLEERIQQTYFRIGVSSIGGADVIAP